MIPPRYVGRVDSRFCGHCHHATLAMYYLLGGADAGYKVRKAVDELRISHYWLESPTGETIDPTVEQYTDLGRSPPYSEPPAKRVSHRKSKVTTLIISNVQRCLDADKVEGQGD